MCARAWLSVHGIVCVCVCVYVRISVCVFVCGGFGPSAQKLQVGDGDFSFVISAFSDQPIRIHPW